MDGPDPQARYDQLIAASGELARAVRAHYDRMLQLGFDHKSALELAVAYQATVMVTAATI